MSVGNVLATVVRVWTRNLPRFFLLTVICWLPIVAFYLVMAVDALDGVLDRYYEWWYRRHELLRGEIVGAGWIFEALCAAAIAVCTIAVLRDDRVGIWRGLGSSLRRTPALIGGALIARLATTGVLFAIQIVRFEPYPRFRGNTIAETIAYAALWIVLSSFAILVLPVLVAERRGVWASVRRALALASGERIKVLAVVLVHYVLVFAIHFALWQFFIVNAMEDGLETYRSRVELYGYIRFGVDLVLSSLAAVIAAVVYERLRAAKEGPAPDQLHAVFD